MAEHEATEAVIELLDLFEQCMGEAEMHTAVGLYGVVSYEEVFTKRGSVWLAARDEQVRAEAKAEERERIATAIETQAEQIESAQRAIHRGYLPILESGIVAGYMQSAGVAREEDA